jgi:hypothetical protein
MFYRSAVLTGNERNYVLWKISQKKNESDVLKKYTPKTGKQKNHSRQRRERRLTEGGIGHSEARANMFGEKFNGAAIGYRVGLRQVFHGFYQHFLAVDIAGIGSALALFTR